MTLGDLPNVELLMAMYSITILTLTARTVSLLLTDDNSRFSLVTPVKWKIVREDNTEIISGLAASVALFIDDLQPDETYTIITEQVQQTFHTKPCAGLINVTDHGASEDLANNADAFDTAIALTPRGGTLFVPAGRYHTGPIFLKSDITLYLHSGAELYAISDRDSWPTIPALDAAGRTIGTWEGEPALCYASLLNAFDCDNIAITGTGTIDGGGDRGDWWLWPKETRNGARRPRTLHVAYSHNASLTGVTVKNSPSWTIHPFNCTDLHVSNLSIYNPSDSPNTDGLNPESCARVEITAVDFSVGDDCIAIKAGKRVEGSNDHLAPTSDVAITHCRMQRGHGAVVLGSEMSGDIVDVSILHCEFHGTDRGLRLKTRRGRGGKIHRVKLSNIDMWNVATPVAINAFYFCDPDGKDDWVQSRKPRLVDSTTPFIFDITVEEARAYNVSLAAVAILGLPEAPITGVQIKNFYISFASEATPDVPLMALGVEPVCRAGIVAQFATFSGELKDLREDRESA